MSYKKITEVQNSEQLQQEDSLIIVSDEQVKQIPVSNVKFGSEPVVYFYNTKDASVGNAIYKGIKDGNKYIISEERLNISDVQNDFLNSNVFIAGGNGTTSWDPTVQNYTGIQGLQKVIETIYISNTTESTNWNLNIRFGNSGSITLYDK